MTIISVEMKRFLTLVSALVVSGAVLSAQETSTTKDTLVVVVKHEAGEVFFETVGKPFKKGYKAVENAVVGGYKAVENAVVDGYKATENAFVEPFQDTETASRMYRKGYRADVELSWANPNHWGISTSHGRSFGNGLYAGGGAGFYAIMADDVTYYTPVFADIKYSFINRLASPFVSAKAGGLIDITNSGIRTFINPALGVDIDRFSIKVGYEYQLGCWGFGKGTHNHQIKCGVGFTF